MTMSDLKHKECESIESNSDATEYRQLATIIVNNLLTRAVSKVNEQIFQMRASQMNVTPKYNETNLDLMPNFAAIWLSVGNKVSCSSETISGALHYWLQSFARGPTVPTLCISLPSTQAGLFAKANNSFVSGSRDQI
ncbi:unnamed protein product [Oppiella nova]|uniref:Uncharacterized protein n=1 Tax=Oppiella nova TaxID=334625 RepID=A0A7R9LBC8_9ACAR|nr:unnamed protein product [Oppiella nova]CAG2161021.1 unnamed protein product [Oppiella nova]